MDDENIELLKFYRSEIKFECELLANRLNSFISSQAFLLIAYAGSMNGLIGRWHLAFALAFPPVLSLLGLALACQARPGIYAALAVIEEWQKKQSALCEAHAELADYRLSHDDSIKRRRRDGSLFARHAPQFFIVAWCYFLALPIYLWLRS